MRNFTPSTVSGKRSSVNKGFKADKRLDDLAAFADYMVYELPPGPPMIPMRVYVNLHKGGMFTYIMALMIYYDNWTIGAWIYLLMHGSYGFFWLLKDFTFPDVNFGRPVTITSFLMPWPIALIPYMMPAYWMVSDRIEVSNERIFVALFLYVNGVVVMLLTDAQKYLVLRERRGLITHAMMGWSRNMNYCGEIVLYSAFGILVQRWEIWAFYSFMWCVVFMIRMLTKDYSLSKKEGWSQYYNDTWMLVPKLFNSDTISIFVYSVAALSTWLTYQNGGIEKTIKLIIN